MVVGSVFEGEVGGGMVHLGKPARIFLFSHITLVKLYAMVLIILMAYTSMNLKGFFFYSKRNQFLREGEIRFWDDCYLMASGS